MLKILVPTDYSPEAKNACLYAYHFAAYTNSSIVLYHAIPVIPPSAEFPIPMENYYLSDKEEILLLEEAFHHLLVLHQLDPKKVKYKGAVNVENSISNGIKYAYDENKCDLVIMGTHGASGFSKIFLGSNTTQLIAETMVPVIAIPKTYRFEPIYHLIYASDLENLKEELGILIPFAEVFHAALELVYFDYASPNSEHLILEAQKFIHQQVYPNIKLSIKKGSIHLSLPENLKRQLNPSNTQMLVLYRAAHTWMENLLLGSNAQKMLLDPGMPILVLHKN